MIWHWTGAIWILTIWFWGIGLTLLALPRRWRRFWPAFCGPAGLALQSAAVWTGAHTAAAGTDRYAWALPVLPIGLWLAAWWRARFVSPPVALWRAVRGWGAVFVLMGGSLVMQCYPFTKPPATLTAVAISSCDAADYAAGARVFKECSRDDRDGFLGANGTDPRISTDHFFTFWLRINHFSPSALIALHAAIIGRQPHELVTLFGAVLAVLALPAVCWLARALFGFGTMGALGVTALYAFSPIVYYTVYQTALGQLLAAPAVALLTWVAWQAYRAAREWRRLAQWLGLLFLGDWLILGGYNFFILFTYVPALALVGITTLRNADWTRLGRWLFALAASLAAAAMIFPERAISIIERFTLFHEMRFGWSIPGFWPTGWYGAFSSATELLPTGSVIAGVAVGLALLATVVTAFKKPRLALVAASCTLPIFFGYWYLLRLDRIHGDLSSYDAFKLFAVFYPGILMSLCLWLGVPGRVWSGGAFVLWIALAAINVTGVASENPPLRRTPLVVGRDLIELAQLEYNPVIDAVDIDVPDVWEGLWANHFLLHLPQDIVHSTYEGRPARAATARWDLHRRFPSARVAGAPDLLASNPTYTVADRQDPRFVTVAIGGGWWPEEKFHARTWYWSRNSGEVVVENGHPATIAAKVSFGGHSLHPRHLRLRAGDLPLWEGMVPATTAEFAGIALQLPPGPTRLFFDSPEPPERPPGEVRGLTFQLESLFIDLE